MSFIRLGLSQCGSPTARKIMEYIPDFYVKFGNVVTNFYGIIYYYLHCIFAASKVVYFWITIWYTLALLFTIKPKHYGKTKAIEALQFFVTGLSEGAFVHKMQGQLFNSKGFTKLGQKYIDHFNEEMGWVEKFTERILDLGGEIKFEGMKSRGLQAADFIS